MKVVLRKIWASIKDNNIINTIAIYINLIFRRDEFIQRETSVLKKFYTADHTIPRGLSIWLTDASSSVVCPTE
ncbi:MAG: hypothetical protein SNH28_07140 [Rikenellaceae bacterium]